MGLKSSAYGSIDFSTPGPRQFLKIVAQGPANGGETLSPIEWLGAYGGKGRIAQFTPTLPTIATNFDIYAGTATQAVPEPVSGLLVVIGTMAAMMACARRRHPAR
jgi:hypothetical protein